MNQKGFTFVELLISLTLTLLLATGLAKVMVQNVKVNKAQQMHAQAQSNAINTMEMVVAKLRSAGWDPKGAGIDTLNLVSASEIEIFADFDGDELTESLNEQVLIKLEDGQINWTPGVDEDSMIMAKNISLLEFVPNGATVTVTITAQSPEPDPRNGEFIEYSVSNDVVLRKLL